MLFKRKRPSYTKAYLDPFDFAAEFIVGLRKRVKKEKKERTNISTRQGLNLLRFLSAILMLKGELRNGDYIRAAVKTTPPELRKLTRDVAVSVLFPEDEEYFRVKTRNCLTC